MSDRAEERERNPEQGRRAVRKEEQLDRDTPAKRHGDALQDGSGNRHGVHERGEKPDTCGT